MSYAALVTRIESVHAIEGADKIQLAKVAGYDVIVDVSMSVTDMIVFFPQDGQLSEEFATINDLVRRKDKDGKPAGGYFEPNRRVRAIKMRGVKSEGFVCPLSFFDYAAPEEAFLVGDTFTEINGHEICCKYETPSTKKAREDKQRIARRGETDMFKKQFDINQFRYKKNEIPDFSIIYITEKMHGTSHRISNVLDDKPLTFWDHVKFFLGIPIDFKREWKILNGSKNVILESAHARTITSFYGGDQFRHDAVEGIVPAKGETIYGEIIGWHRNPRSTNDDVADFAYDQNDGMIMEPQDTSKLPEVRAIYGDHIAYRYGLNTGECKFVVYRITMTNEDGYVTELSWPQVVKRCRELGIEHVPELATVLYDGEVNELEMMVDRMVNGLTGLEALPSTVDPSHILEGVVVRWEHADGFGWAKHKSTVFGMLEGYIKERDEYVDMEEIS